MVDGVAVTVCRPGETIEIGMTVFSRWRTASPLWTGSSASLEESPAPSSARRAGGARGRAAEAASRAARRSLFFGACPSNLLLPRRCSRCERKLEKRCAAVASSYASAPPGVRGPQGPCSDRSALPLPLRPPRARDGHYSDNLPWLVCIKSSRAACMLAWVEAISGETSLIVQPSVGTGSSTRTRYRPGRARCRFVSTITVRGSETTGMIGACAATARRKAPILNGRSSGAVLRWPSGMNQTAIFSSRMAAAAASSDARACRASPRSMIRLPESL